MAQFLMDILVVVAYWTLVCFALHGLLMFSLDKDRPRYGLFLAIMITPFIVLWLGVQSALDCIADWLGWQKD